MKLSYSLLFALVLGFTTANAQKGYWQQNIDYTMRIDFDTEKHQFKGE